MALGLSFAAEVRAALALGRMAVVLITGCSSGFGLAFAEAFARRGDTVVATMRTPRPLDGMEVLPLDVTDSASIEGAVARVLEQHGHVDVLINNAGVGAVGALETLPDAVLRDVFETNVFGALAVTRAVLPHMRKQGSGRVVFVSAIGSVLNTAYLGAYCASKHALDCVSATLDIEVRPFGIRVSSVLPSAFRTAMGDKLHLAHAEGDAYHQAALSYMEGLRARIESGPADLTPVVDAVLEAVTADDPRQRYLVAPHLREVLGPVMTELEKLHDREVALTPSGGGNAPTR